MGANPSQALAVLVLLTGGILFSAALYVGGNILLLLLALVAIIAAVAIFRKARPLENAGEEPPMERKAKWLPSVF